MCCQNCGAPVVIATVTTPVGPASLCWACVARDRNPAILMALMEVQSLEYYWNAMEAAQER